MIQKFLNDLQLRAGCSINTTKAYKKDLDLFESFQKTGQALPNFYCFLSEKGLSPRSQARVISCVRTYFKFLQAHGKAVDIKSLIPPRFKAPLPQAIHLKEFRLLWDVCKKESSPPRALRNQLVLACLYGLGCRVSELVTLDLKDFNESSAWLSVTGKGSKQRLLPLPTKLYQLVLRYLQRARPLLILSKKTSSMILNNRGGRPSRVDIWRWLKSWSLKAGLKGIKNPHAFRHGCATGLLDQGADLRAIQQLLGHSNLQTTQIYTSVSAQHLKKVVEKHHPLS